MSSHGQSPSARAERVPGIGALLARLLAVACPLSCAAIAGAQGPDIIYFDCPNVAQSVEQHAAIGGVRAYSIESQACNIGTANLMWNRSPGFASNLYRIQDGRIQQIGQSWVKYAIAAAAGPGCGTCNGVMGNQLGVGCLDVYDSLYNGGQNRLGPRSGVNAFTGTFANLPPGNFNSIVRRMQVNTTDLVTGLEPQFFMEGMFVATDDIAAGNALNNVSYKPITVLAGTLNLVPQGTITVGQPAIKAWRLNALGPGDIDFDIEDAVLDVPNEGRFHVSHKATDLGDGTWRYEYAIFNQNSDVAAGSFSIPLAAGATVTNVGFSDINPHSGEVYAATDWTVSITGTSITWSSPQTFAQNPNSNALRWGTMYNFWFRSTTAPALGCATVGLFKPYTPQAVQLSLRVPGGGGPCAATCAADFNGLDGVTSQDIFDFLAQWLVLNPITDFNNSGTVSTQDLFDFLEAWIAGCP
jgi:hypothetical protein